jgi:hypothetical protein
MFYVFPRSKLASVAREWPRPRRGAAAPACGGGSGPGTGPEHPRPGNRKVEARDASPLDLQETPSKGILARLVTRHARWDEASLPPRTVRPCGSRALLEERFAEALSTSRIWRLGNWGAVPSG